MTPTPDSPMARAWARIEAEQHSDRVLRRLTVVGWSATGLVVVLLAVSGLTQFRFAMSMVRVGANTVQGAIGSIVPVVLAIGVFCALGATLATVGLFLRMRSASLHEIQLRLAALEDLLTQETLKREL